MSTADPATPHSHQAAPPPPPGWGVQKGEFFICFIFRCGCKNDQIFENGAMNPPRSGLLVPPQGACAQKRLSHFQVVWGQKHTKTGQKIRSYGASVKHLSQKLYRTVHAYPMSPTGGSRGPGARDIGPFGGLRAIYGQGGHLSQLAHPAARSEQAAYFQK